MKKSSFTRKKSSQLNKESLGWVFIAPSLILFMIALGYPIFYAIRLSFFHVSLDFSQTFVGFDNFLKAFSDKWFWNTIEKTFTYTFSSVFITVLLGLLISLALNNDWLKVKSIFHMIFLVPWTLSFVVTGSIWRWIMNASYGILNSILRSINLIEENISFFGDPSLAMPSVIFVNVWRSVPFAMVMLYAGLQLVPDDQLEASKVDGANSIQEFWYIVLPNIRGVLAVTTVLLTIWTFIQFDLTQILTLGGGPNHATELMSNYIYTVSFKFYDFGYGSAIAVLMLGIILFMTIIYVRFLEQEI
jgi:multiple sugar transport system permease protein